MSDISERELIAFKAFFLPARTKKKVLNCFLVIYTCTKFYR